MTDKKNTVTKDTRDAATTSATFTYTVIEATGKDGAGKDKVENVINDSSKVVTIEVGDNGDGTLDIKKTVDGVRCRVRCNQRSRGHTGVHHQPL